MTLRLRYGMTVQTRPELGDTAVHLGLGVGDKTDWPDYRGIMLEPTEARQLAATLVALADAIEIGDALSRAEIAEILRAEGYRTSDRQLRHWASIGRIPHAVVRKPPHSHMAPYALYRRDQIPAIRAVAERYSRKEQP